MDSGWRSKVVMRGTHPDALDSDTVFLLPSTGIVVKRMCQNIAFFLSFLQPSKFPSGATQGSAIQGCEQTDRNGNWFSLYVRAFEAAQVLQFLKENRVNVVFRGKGKHDPHAPARLSEFFPIENLHKTIKDRIIQKVDASRKWRYGVGPRGGQGCAGAVLTFILW